MKKIVLISYILIFSTNISIFAHDIGIAYNNLQNNIHNMNIYYSLYEQRTTPFLLENSLNITIGTKVYKQTVRLNYDINFLEKSKNSIIDNILLTLFHFQNDYIYEKEFNWYGLSYKQEFISKISNNSWHDFDLTFTMDMSSNQNSKILNDLDDKYLKNELCLFTSFAIRYRNLLFHKIKLPYDIDSADYRFENILYINHYKKTYNQFEIRNSMYLKHKLGWFLQADYSHLIINDYHKDFFRLSLGYMYSFEYKALHL